MNQKIKNLKIYQGCSKIVPYALITGGIVLGLHGCGVGYPVYLDDVVCCSHIQETFDNKGNIEKVVQYESFLEERNVLYQYGEWKRVEEGYLREVLVYRLPYFSKEDVMHLFEVPDLKIEDVLGEPISRKTEMTNTIEGKDALLEAVMYRVDQNDCVVVKQSIQDDYSETLGVLGLTLLSCWGYYAISTEVKQKKRSKVR